MAALEEFAARGTGDVAAHLQDCITCSDHVKDIRANEQFLKDAARMLANLPEPPVGKAGGGSQEEAPGYELLQEIGRGGQGVVYRAIQAATRRPAAIKMLLHGRFATPRQVQRFEREVEIAARLRHPGIVTVFESGTTREGTPYVAMEFIDGVSLDRWAPEGLGPVEEGGRARVERATRLMQKVASAVGYAHTAGVIHRDLKPSNIFVDRTGEPRVLDFGLARTADGDQTVTLEFAGTPAFAAPEQLSGGALISARSDVYALGVIMYWLLTGRHPYPINGRMEDLIRHVKHVQATPPSRHMRRLPKDVETIVLKAMAKDPNRRYASAAELASDLDDHLRGRPISARRDSAWYVLSRLAMRHRLGVGLGLLAAATLIGGTIGLAILARDLDVQRADAERARKATEAALAESTIHRARLMGAAGEQGVSERLLWREAQRAGVDVRNPNLGLEDAAIARQVSWALIEYFSRLPRRLRFSLGTPVAYAAIDDDGMVWAVGSTGSWARWNVDGDLVASGGPALPQTGVSSLSRFAPQPTPRIIWTDGWSLQLIEPMTKKLLAERPWDGPRMKDIGFSANGRSLAVLTVENDLHVLDGETLEEIFVLADPGLPVSTPRFSPNGEILSYVTGSGREQTVRRWSRSTLAPYATDITLNKMGLLPTVELRQSVSSNDGRWVAGAMYGTVVVWDTTSDDAPHSKTFQGMVDTINFDDASTRMMVSASDGTFSLIQLADFVSLGDWKVLGRVVTPAVVPQSGPIVVGSMDGAVSVFDIDSGLAIRHVPSPEGMHDVALSPDGHTAAWGGDQGLVILYDLVRHEEICRIAAHDGLVTALVFSPDGKELLSTGLDGAIRRWDVPTGTLLGVVAERMPRQWALLFSPDGRYLASGGIGNTVVVLTPGGSLPRFFVLPGTENYRNLRIPSMAFSPDGRTLGAVATTAPTRAVLWDVESGAVLAVLPHTYDVRAIAFSPDGRTVATGSDDQSIRFWNSETGECIKVIDGIEWDVFELAYHPSERVVFCIGRGNELKVFDTETGAELASMRGHELDVFALRAAPDGKSIFTAGQDPWVSIWDLEELRRYVRGNLPAEMR